ncbi:MAG TPA: hypothetical protein VLF39_01625 [Candidatus Saccharimonadales bacterium]|nr:hypothetical protein [Candidatus Saccharimonadales bacterium]
MKKLNESGIGTIETILILIIVSMIGATGWYVWHSKQSTDDSLNKANQNSYAQTTKITNFDECKKAVGSKIQETFPEICATKNGQKFTDTSDETANWYLFNSAKYSIRIPDGWDLTTNTDVKNLFTSSANDIVYKKGTKAKVEETIGGKDFTNIPFLLDTVSQGPTNADLRGVKQTDFKTAGGLTVKKYYFVQKEKTPMMDIPFGTKEYTYFVGSGSVHIYAVHDILNGEKDQTPYIEDALKTLVIK